MITDELFKDKVCSDWSLEPITPIDEVLYADIAPIIYTTNTQVWKNKLTNTENVSTTLVYVAQAGLDYNYLIVKAISELELYKLKANKLNVRDILTKPNMICVKQNNLGIWEKAWYIEESDLPTGYLPEPGVKLYPQDSLQEKLKKWQEVWDKFPYKEELSWERHGKGWALYCGRSDTMHGYNILTVDDHGFDSKAQEVRDFFEMAHKAIPILLSLGKFAQLKELEENYVYEDIDDIPEPLV